MVGIFEAQSLGVQLATTKSSKLAATLNITNTPGEASKPASRRKEMLDQRARTLLLDTPFLSRFLF
jgi:hypothetical protein